MTTPDNPIRNTLEGLRVSEKDYPRFEVKFVQRSGLPGVVRYKDRKQAVLQADILQDLNFKNVRVLFIQSDTSKPKLVMKGRWFVG